MAIDFEALKAPLSDEQPCGPDLDLEGDPDYMNLVARMEGLLPESFFSFDRGSIDFKAEIEALSVLLRRTRDLRLLTLLAKLLILDRDLSGFADCAAFIGTLLKEHWSDVHPRGPDGDLSLRAAVLQTLDDLPTTILPLQYAPLVQSRRSGAVSYRSHMIAAGEVARRAQEEAPDQAAIEFAFSEIEFPALLTVRDNAERLRRAVAQIRMACVENAGFGEAPGLERLAPLADKMLALLDGFVAKRDPAAVLHIESGPEQTGHAAAGTAGTPESPGSDAGDPGTRRRNVATTRDAAAILASVTEFLNRQEPSSPALLLVRQAEQLVGKNIVEIMRILVPEMVNDAKVSVGAEQPIAFPVERLSKLMPETPIPSAEENGAERIGASSGEDRGPPVRTRADAMALLEQVGAFYRVAEPTNPIPLLVERARALSTVDFLSLLKELSPKRK